MTTKHLNVDVFVSDVTAERIMLHHGWTYILKGQEVVYDGWAMQNGFVVAVLRQGGTIDPFLLFRHDGSRPVIK
jgi:hypothetical protein